MLIQAVVDWAARAGLPGVTLLIFRDVPWNGPYHTSLSFEPLADAELVPELMALRVHERDLDLDRDRKSRPAMRLNI